jgi:hypothetical protein
MASSKKLKVTKAQYVCLVLDFHKKPMTKVDILRQVHVISGSKLPFKPTSNHSYFTDFGILVEEIDKHNKILSDFHDEKEAKFEEWDKQNPRPKKMCYGKKRNYASTPAGKHQLEKEDAFEKALNDEILKKYPNYDRGFIGDDAKQSFLAQGIITKAGKSKNTFLYTLTPKGEELAKKTKELMGM